MSVPPVRHVLLTSGLATLAWAWIGPLPRLSGHAFTAHMTLHMIVVAVSAPLIAWAGASYRWDPVKRVPRLFAPVQASVAELVVVWVWHTPALHVAARQNTAVFALEQVSFLAAGLYLWLAARGGASGGDRSRALAGAGSVLFTSMHMTLLGALFALGPRPLYAHGGQASGAALQDQQLGGVIMLLLGGASYLTGGLLLIRAALGFAPGRVRARA